MLIIKPALFSVEGLACAKATAPQNSTDLGCLKLSLSEKLLQSVHEISFLLLLSFLESCIIW